jgi:hypothetical protein
MRFTEQNKKKIDPRYFLNEAVGTEKVDVIGDPLYITGQKVDVKGEPMYIRGGLPKVRQLQDLLKMAGLYTAKAEGIVGPKTIQAVEKMAGVPAGTVTKKDIINNIDSYIMWAGKAAGSSASAQIAKGAVKGVEQAEKDNTVKGLGAAIAAAADAGQKPSAKKAETPPAAPATAPTTTYSSSIGKKIGEPKEGDEMKGELGPEVYHKGEWIPKSEYEQLKKGLQESVERDLSYNRIKEQKNKKLFEALIKG